MLHSRASLGCHTRPADNVLLQERHPQVRDLLSCPIGNHVGGGGATFPLAEDDPDGIGSVHYHPGGGCRGVMQAAE